MERFVFEFVCRALLIAAAAWIVLRVLRVRGAAAQHAVWTGVMVAMLVLPFWIVWGPRASITVLPMEDVPAVTGSTAPAPLAIPTFSLPATKLLQPAASNWPGWDWRLALAGVYLLGAGALLFRLAAGTIRARRLTSASCAAPITVGWFRPRVILPDGWREWPTAQLAAVLAHEEAHVRRRDPLVQWLALFNRGVFWFHPLAWWLERRLTALAEEACDAAVLERGHDPREYSGYLLDLARAVERAGTRVNVAGMAMPGSHLPQRIRKMMGGVVAPRVSPARMAAAAFGCVICTAMFGAGELQHSKPRRWLTVSLVTPQTPPTAPARFEVASIKPCKNDSGISGGPGRKSGRGGGAVGGSPGRLIAECVPLLRYIQWAYLMYPEGKAWPVDPSSGLALPPQLPRLLNQLVKGGPGWIESERYTIEAKSASPQTTELMRGPMLRALLEERFQLKVHAEPIELPVYALTVAKGGPKLQPTRKGSCIPLAEFDGPAAHPTPQQRAMRVCGPFGPSILKTAPGTDRETAFNSVGVDTYGQTLAGLARQLSVRLDREVIDRTGIAGLFDMRLELTMLDLFPEGPRDGSAALLDATGAITHAVQKLGLKLEPAKEPARLVVIDRIERPSQN